MYTEKLSVLRCVVEKYFIYTHCCMYTFKIFKGALSLCQSPCLAIENKLLLLSACTFTSHQYLFAVGRYVLQSNVANNEFNGDLKWSFKY